MLILALLCTVGTAAAKNNAYDDVAKLNSQLSKAMSQENRATTSLNPAVCERVPVYITGITALGFIKDSNIDKTKMIIQMDNDPYGSISLTRYLRSDYLKQKNATKNVLIFPGQSLSDEWYSEMAQYYAGFGYTVYVADRREASIPMSETDFGFMKNWYAGSGNIDSCMRDTYYHVSIARLWTALANGCSSDKVKTFGIGHSHGALIVSTYAASIYQYRLGKIDRILPVDMVVAFDPQYTDLINNQAQEFNDVSAEMTGGKYYDDTTKNSIQLTYLVSQNSDSPYPLNTAVTNKDMFIMMVSQTYLFMTHPYVPGYCYYAMGPNGLEIDMSRIIDVTLKGAYPYSPNYMNEYMAGLESGKYVIDASRIKVPVDYIGFDKGFGPFGAWWYQNQVGKTNKKVTTKIFSGGHAHLTEAPEVWKYMAGRMASGC